MLLEVDDIHVHYGRIEALKGISFTRRRGRDRHAHRRQRGGQDDDPEDDLRRPSVVGGTITFDGQDITRVAGARAGRSSASARRPRAGASSRA